MQRITLCSLVTLAGVASLLIMPPVMMAQSIESIAAPEIKERSPSLFPLSASGSEHQSTSESANQSSLLNEAQPEAAIAPNSFESTLTPEYATLPPEPEPFVTLDDWLDAIESMPEQMPDSPQILGQVTSVSQLRDVLPTDWAFEALQALVERYGCIAGYPDGTYRGDRSLTRYEFAAGLNACLDNLNELLDFDIATTDDLSTIERLQNEFAAELATIRSRVDGLDARINALEAQQFSTTTVLRGNVWFNLTHALPTGDILAERNPAVPDSAFAPPLRDANNRPTRVERDQPEVAFSYYAWLTFNTSFTGRDSLVTQLAVGNGNSPANQLVSAGFFNSWGVPFLDQTGTPTADEITVRELFYSFPLTDNVQLDVGPRLNYYRYFDANRFTFFQTGASSFNSSGSTLLNAIDRGSGAVVQWRISRPLELTLAYLAENTEFLNPNLFNTSSDPRSGFFNSSNTISAQLEYSPSPNFNLRLVYARSSLKAYNGFIGSAVGEPLPYGYADDGFGGTVQDSGGDTFVANFDWLIDDWIGLFGRYSYGQLDINPVNPNRAGGDIRVQSFQVGVGFPDLFKEGALGVISFVMPHDYLEGREFLLSGGGDGGTQYELEVSYRYPINNNLSLVPSLYVIWNPNNFDSNPTVLVGNLRTQFSF
jgi:hypothetical protein